MNDTPPLEALTEILDTPRGRYLCRMAGAGYLIRRADLFAAIGTATADETAKALRNAAALKVAAYVDPFDQEAGR